MYIPEDEVFAGQPMRKIRDVLATALQSPENLLNIEPFQKVLGLDPEQAVEVLPGEWYTDADADRRAEIHAAIHRMTGMVKSQFPSLFDMAADWFDRIIE